MACSGNSSILALQENVHCGKKSGVTTKELVETSINGKTKDTSKQSKKDLAKKETSCSKSYDKRSTATINKSATKFPPFRAGKYVPKETVYSPLYKQEGLNSSKGKSSNEKLNLSPSCSPPSSRTNKFTHRVSIVYASAGEKFDSSCVKVKHPVGQAKRTPQTESTNSKSHISTTTSLTINSPRFNSPKGKVTLQENRRACSLEGISKQSHVNSLKVSSHSSHSAESIDISKSNPRTRPKSASVENAEQRRLRTQTENSARPKSSTIESPRQQLSKSAKAALNPLYKIIQDNRNHHNGVEHTDKLSPLSPKSHRRNLDTSTAHKNRPKSITLLDNRTGRDNQENRFLRKGSDSRDKRPARPHSAVFLTSSESERTYRQIKPRKARRVPQRNIYVKRQKKLNTPRTLPQRISPAKPQKYNVPKQVEKLPKDQVDSIPLIQEKKRTFSAFGDKFCIRTKIIDKEIIIPKLKRCRVMVWKIRRISYDFYEKVLHYLFAFDINFKDKIFLIFIPFVFQPHTLMKK